MLMHRLRSECDAIAVGRTTDEREHPRLDVRHWCGKQPLRIVISRDNPELKGIDFDRPVIPQLMEWLRERHCQSLLVEGGARTLQAFLDSDCWDAIRVETSPQTVASGTKAPELPGDTRLKEEKHYDGNTIRFYEK